MIFYCFITMVFDRFAITKTNPHAGARSFRYVFAKVPTTPLNARFAVLCNKLGLHPARLRIGYPISWYLIWYFALIPRFHYFPKLERRSKFVKHYVKVGAPFQQVVMRFRDHDVTEWATGVVPSKALDEHSHQVAREFDAFFVEHVTPRGTMPTKRVSLPDVPLHD